MELKTQQSFIQKLSVLTISTLFLASCGSGYGDADPYEPQTHQGSESKIPKPISPFLELEHAKKQIPIKSQ
jgi:hypothetical protein